MGRMRPSDLDPANVAERIDVPVSDWAGNCFAIACKMIREGVVGGEVRYGHYYGPLADESPFAELPVVRHGWIRQSQPKIIDPTRWAFTQPTEPCIMVGQDFDQYDPGGQAMIRAKRAAQRAPSWVEDRAKHDLSALSGSALERVREILEIGPEIGEITTAQLNWVANAPIDRLGEHGPEIYRWISDLGHSSFIPIDNQALVLGRDADPSAYDYARAE